MKKYYWIQNLIINIYKKIVFFYFYLSLLIINFKIYTME